MTVELSPLGKSWKNLPLPPEHVYGTPERKLAQSEVEELTRQKVREIIAQISSLNRFGILTPGNDERRLASIYAQDEVYIEGADPGVMAGQTDGETAQTAIVNILASEYGFDPESHYPTDRLKGLANEYTEVDAERFPSKTIPGLGFTRVLVSDRQTGLKAVHWYANDIASPLRIKGKDILRPKK